MVRMFSVFWAGAAPGIIPAIAPFMRSPPETQITVATVIGVGGGLYAGGVSAFVAIKNKGFGMRVQGVAVGYCISTITQSLFIGPSRIFRVLTQILRAKPRSHCRAPLRVPTAALALHRHHC